MLQAGISCLNQGIPAQQIAGMTANGEFFVQTLID